MTFETSCYLVFFFLAVGLASSSPSYISYDVLDAHMVGGRGLLENELVKSYCPINFEKENYAALTGQCKGPIYNPRLCCDGFKKVACKYADEINNVDNGCAMELFYFINLQGKYPEGLFLNLCKEGREGLDCGNW